MLSNSDVRQPFLLDLGDGSWYYNYNIQEIRKTDENGEEKTVFECETVHIWANPDYETILPAIVAERYSQSEEIALINKGIEDKKNPEYVAYRKWVTEMKDMVKKDLEKQ
jgi:hypothetical protein